MKRNGEPASLGVPPPEPESLSGSLRRNIQSLEERRREEAAGATREERLADHITSFAGSMRFVYLHLVLYGTWILANVMPALPKFDPSFVILAMEASVEAIFLSTFVLISQNRNAAAADKRADLDLHISLLAEHELTALTQLVKRIADRLEVQVENQKEIAEAMRDVAPEAVLDTLEAGKNEI
jgi:uncharacterized membrane protein